MNYAEKVAACERCVLSGTSDCAGCKTEERDINRFETACLLIIAGFFWIAALWIWLIIIGVDLIFNFLMRIKKLVTNEVSLPPD